MVGISGQLAIRCGLATASARTLPSSARDLALERNTKAPWISPVTTAAPAGPVPRYGTSTMRVPASALSCVIEIAGDVAGPELAKLTLAGFALASAITSATDR